LKFVAQSIASPDIQGILGQKGTVETFNKNKETNETTESAEKYSVSSKRVAPLLSPLWGGEEWNEREIIGFVMNFNVVRLKEGSRG